MVPDCKIPADAAEHDVLVDTEKVTETFFYAFEHPGAHRRDSLAVCQNRLRDSKSLISCRSIATRRRRVKSNHQKTVK